MDPDLITVLLVAITNLVTGLGAYFTAKAQTTKALRRAPQDHEDLSSLVDRTENTPPWLRAHCDKQHNGVAGAGELKELGSKIDDQGKAIGEMRVDLTIVKTRLEERTKPRRTISSREDTPT
jgi:hypothetical protein